MVVNLFFISSMQLNQWLIANKFLVSNPRGNSNDSFFLFGLYYYHFMIAYVGRRPFSKFWIRKNHKISWTQFPEIAHCNTIYVRKTIAMIDWTTSLQHFKVRDETKISLKVFFLYFILRLLSLVSGHYWNNVFHTRNGLTSVDILPDVLSLTSWDLMKGNASVGTNCGWSSSQILSKRVKPHLNFYLFNHQVRLYNVYSVKF